MFVSVGAGPLGSAPGRFFVKLALSLADYRSYRDVPSREVVEGIGVRTKDDRIYPDLVFGLSALCRRRRRFTRDDPSSVSA